MVSHNEAASRHDRRARELPVLNASVNSTGAPASSRRSTGYHGRNGRHAENGRRHSVPGSVRATMSRPQNDCGTASSQGLNNHGNQNASCALLGLSANPSTDAVNTETSTQRANSASVTLVNRRNAHSGAIGQSMSFSGSRSRRILPESQRAPSSMSPPGHEPPASITMSPTPIRMFNRPKGKVVEEEYILPSPVGSNVTVAKRGSFRKRSNYWGGGGDDDAIKRRISNPRLQHVLSSRPPPRQRQKPVSERPILRMSGHMEARYL